VAIVKMKLKRSKARFRIAAALFLSLCGSAWSQNASVVTPPEVLADQLRTQGYPCDRVLSAVQDIGASKSDEAVWVLRCTNANYRVRLIPDLAAIVQKVD
jgi:hypothetical protein